MRTNTTVASATTAAFYVTASAMLLVGAGSAMGALHVAATCFGTFRAASFAQAVLHRWIGHGGLIGSIRRSHIRSHHSIFRGRNFEAEVYSDEEISVSHTFAPVAAAIGALSCWLLPLDLAIASLLSLVFAYGAHVYVHEHFHLAGSWLLRFAWFRHLKELHRIHHVNPRKNFGLLDHASDRLFGTFAAGTANEGMKAGQS